MLSAHDPPTICVQSILYNTPLMNIERALVFLDNAAKIVKIGVGHLVSVAYGDCSPNRIIAPDRVEEWRRRFDNIHAIDYVQFNGNLGSAAGHNRLLAEGASDLITFMNPDVLVAPDIFVQLLSGFEPVKVGLVEARQLPIE